MEEYQRQIIETNDGSSSLFVPELNETYHSVKGAETESTFVYIDHGLRLIDQNIEPIRVLEVGMGTALNVLLSYEFALAENRKIELVTLEPYPIDIEQIKQLNYASNRTKEVQDVFLQFHESPFGRTIEIDPYFSFRKEQVRLQEYTPQEDFFHVVYFDAFAPSKQSEIWEKDLLAKLFTSMKSGGVLTTYCSQGQFKRDLKEVGFDVKNPPGPMGKKQMTVASKLAGSQDVG